MPSRKDRTQSLVARARFRIDDLQVQPDRLVVLRGEEEIKLELRMMEVLVMLAEHAGETVSKERLLVDVWGSAVYGDSPVSKTVSNLRTRIRDDRHRPRYIETVSGVGYRLMLPVSLPEDYRRMPSNPWTGGNPYVGLSAFDAAHAAVFCGRSRIVADLLRAMRNQIDNQRRFVLMVGASGCGKTSLLRAGAIPLLTKSDGFDGLRALSIADCDLAAANAGDPLAPLIAALATWSIDERPVFPQQTQEQLKSLLTGSPESIAGFAAEAFRKRFPSDQHEQPHAHLLLTIDHAEALVAAADIDADAQEGFLRLLLALCASPHVLVVMIARSDFYPKLIEALPALAERKAGDGHLDILAPRYGEIGEIIRTPAWKADIGFGVDPETMTRLDDALLEAALAQPDALPLLQHTLQTLYERCKDQRQLTFAVYNEMGGLEGAVAYRAEQVFAALPENAKASLDKVLSRLIVIQPDSDVVSARRADIDAFDIDARTLIDAFISARLFVGGLQDGRPTVGVVHEALLRRWPRASEWTQDNRRLLQAKARLERAARRWAEEGRSPDHLLNPGRPLGEAREVECSLPEGMGKDVLDFLHASDHQSKRKRNLKRLAIASLVVLSIASTTLAIAAVLARNDARSRQEKEHRLMTYMLGPLADELRILGKLDLLAGIGNSTLNAGSDDFNDMTESEILVAARAARSIGESLYLSGDRKTGLAYFHRAKIAADTALRRTSNLEPALFERGNASYWLGYHDYENRHYSGAEIHWRDYLRDSRKLTSISGENPEWVREESYALNNLGTLELRKGNPEKALPLFLASARSKKSAIALARDDPAYLYDYIDSLSWISSTQQALGDIQAAASGYDRQILMLKELVASKKDPNAWRIRLANYLQLSANLEISLGRITEAQARADESVRILSELHNAAPTNNEWAENLVRGHILSAKASRIRGDVQSQQSSLDYANKIIDSLPPDKKVTLSWRILSAHLLFSTNGTQGIQNAHQRHKAIDEMRFLTSANKVDEAIIEYARMLVEEGKRHSSHDRGKAIEEWNLARTTLAQSTSRKDSAWLHVWVETHIYLGKLSEVIDSIHTLSKRRYLHPEFVKIVRSSGIPEYGVEKMLDPNHIDLPGK
jgi:DNA-binding winged helix-turn-helix (wHTH) protein/tetratricopeptide (TPR) repeat protein